MRFEPQPVEDAFLVHLEPVEDERGFLARSWCIDEFLDAGIGVTWLQGNISYTRHRGTLRGLHWQAEAPEARLLRVVRGEIFDVIVDMRPDSPTYLGHASNRMREGEYQALYVPPLVAHGFMTMTDDVEVHYLHGDMYRPENVRAVRWDDPVLGIAWPMEPTLLSDRDRTIPDFGSTRG